MKRSTFLLCFSSPSCLIGFFFFSFSFHLAGDPDENSACFFFRQLTFELLRDCVKSLIESRSFSFPLFFFFFFFSSSSFHLICSSHSSYILTFIIIIIMDSAANLSTSPGSMGSNASLEIADALFCEHGQEVCTACGFDAREENDAFFGFSPVADRGALTLVDFTRSAKDNSIHCKKHGTVDCKQCFNWKKSITKLQKDASKAQKKKPKNTSNFE